MVPVFLRMTGRPVLVVGGGEVAFAKAKTLARAGAVISVVAPIVRPELAAIASQMAIRPVEEGDLDEAWFLIAAAPPEVNRAVADWAEKRRLFVLAVDDKHATSVFGAATLERGGITIAIGSGGRAPGLVALLRRAIDALLPEDLEGWVALSEHSRERWRAEGVPMKERAKRLLRELQRTYGEQTS